MKIITSYPIIKNGKVVANGEYNSTLDYSSVTGVGKAASGSTSGTTSGAGRRSFNWGNLGQNVDTAVQGVGSIKGAVQGLFGKQKKQQPTPMPPAQPEKTGMSTTSMVLIGVGAVALIGVIFLVKKK